MLLSIYLYSSLCSIFMLIHRNLIMMIDINQSPVLCPHTNKTNIQSLNILNILVSLRVNSLLFRPTLICYVP